MSAMVSVLQRELQVAWRRRSDLLQPLLLFVLVLMLFPLTLGPEPQQLARLAPAAVWIAALLAVVLGLERLFRDDFHEGVLEQLLLAPHPLPLLVLGKLLGHLLVCGLPLVVLTPLSGVLFAVTPAVVETLTLTLLFGLPTLMLVGAIGVALTLTMARGSLLLSLLVVPLYIPVLIFAAAAVDAASMGASAAGPLALLAAAAVAALTLAPLATTAALKLSLA
ncbi:MAG: heme exporter protein CcmB [Gammaproteobacteria bacterium]|nr:heme exporter protein CcmB [Gammaproteobacteria bacterium]